jgi:hypothetical protein
MTQPQAAERRQEVRCFCPLDISCRPTPIKKANPVAATCHDLSSGGIGLILPRQLEAGSLLEIRMQNPKRNYSCTRLVLAVHSRPESDGNWLVGGLFYNELSIEELEGLQT